MTTAGENDTVTIRLGLAAMCAGWFKDIGLQGESSELSAILERDYSKMVEFLGSSFDQVIAPGVISNLEEAQKAEAAFQEEDVDVMLLVHIMWSEDQPLLSLLNFWGDKPILLWNYHPTGSLPPRLSVNYLFRCSGTVGMLQGSAAMQKVGVRVPIVSGAPGDPDLKRTFTQYNTALRIRKELLGLKAGQIAGRCEVMVGTHVDEDALHEILGVKLVPITAQEYASFCEDVSPERVDAYKADVVTGREVNGVSDESLRLACRSTLALDDVVNHFDLGAVAIQDLDPELHRLVGTRPCLYPPQSIQKGIPFTAESDLNTSLGMLAAARAAGSPALYTEIFTYDPQENLLLMGHAGVHDPRLAAEDGITIVPDLEYCESDPVEGAWMEFIMAPGPVTCVSLYDTGHGYRMTAFEGVSIGPPRRLDGWAHALVRPSVDVCKLLPRLVDRGMTQHFPVVHGRVAGILEKWCELSGLEFVFES